jgi:hypothetical protein
VRFRESGSPPSDELSLFGGGPFYRWQLLLHLTTPDGWYFPRRVLWALAVCWLPLVIVTALSHPHDLLNLFQDYRVHATTVVAIPALLLGQSLMEERFRSLATHLREAGLLDGEGKARIHNVTRLLQRLRDSALPDLIIVLAVMVDLLFLGRHHLITGSTWAISGYEPVPRLSVAGWYYLLVGVGIFHFLLLFSFWKWLVWSFFLFVLARTPLNLVATHPDGHGGLGFLGLAATAFTPIAFALSAAIGATWRYDILNSGMTLASLQLPIAALLVVILLAELGPMCFFVPRLMVLRSQAMLEYGILLQAHSSYLHRKWVLHSDDQEQQRPEVSDLTTLASAAAYDRIKRMRPFPFDVGVLIILAVAVLIPLIPVLLAAIPLLVVLQGVLAAVRTAPL